MASRYQKFPISQITLYDKPIVNQFQLKDRDICELKRRDEVCTSDENERDLSNLVSSIKSSRTAGKPVILFMGAHLIKLGLSRYIIDLVNEDYITHVATTGAGLIHDWQLSKHGHTSEDVKASLPGGHFGFWNELSGLNSAALHASATGRGLGEQTGQELSAHLYGNTAALSINATCYLNNCPLTVHVGIGSDILAMYPNFRGTDWGEASHTDFLIFAEAIRKAAGGVFINVGSAVTGPEVFLKAVSMSLNVGGNLDGLDTAVFDLGGFGPAHWRTYEFSKYDSDYYHRPLKSVLRRVPASIKDSHAYWIKDYIQYTVPQPKRVRHH